jgi:hypothetical protein
MLSAKPNYFEKRRSDISSLDHLPDFLKCARKGSWRAGRMGIRQAEVGAARTMIE